MLLLVSVFALVRMSVSAKEMMMRVPLSSELAIEIEEAEKEQDRPGDPRKPRPDAFIERNAEPRDEQAEDRGKQDVAAARQSSYSESLPVTPTLCAGGEHKRKPVRRNGRVKESDAESSDGNGGEDSVVHELVLLLVIVIEHEHEHEQDSKNRAAGI